MNHINYHLNRLLFFSLPLLKDYKNKKDNKYYLISEQFFKLQEDFEKEYKKNYLINIKQLISNKINEDTFRKSVILQCEQFLYLFKQKIKYIQDKYNIE